MTTPRLDLAIARFDAANAADPNRVVDAAGLSRPSELVYAERMTATLAELHPDASEHLRLAVRAQHLRRWLVPRSSYPMDRIGYLRWRENAKRKHAEWAGEFMREIGYPQEDVDRVASLIRKERLKRDPEAQAVEDVAALVFLDHYAADFAARHDPDKVRDILVKTLGKMSERARSLAVGRKLPAGVRAALEAAVAAAEQRSEQP